MPKDKTDDGRLLSKLPRFVPPKEPLALGPIIFVIGPPGSGKGTLCSRICADFPGRFKHLSVGDYLREQFCTNSSDGVPSPSSLPALECGCLTPEEIAKYVREGRLLPPDTLVPLIKAKLLAEDTSPSTCWLIDGFPRDLGTAVVFEEEIAAPTSLIQLTCDDSVSRQRFLTRRRSPSDNEDGFERRLKEYNVNLEPISTYYRGLGFLTYVNSGEDDWVRKALESLKPESIGLDPTVPQKKQ